MKAILGFAFFLLFLAGIALVTLQGRQMAQSGPAGGGAAITGVRWQPVMLGDEGIDRGSGMYIRFGVDGIIEGHGGCNGFFGSLAQSQSGLEVGPLGSTRKACPEPVMNLEAAFLDAVQRTRNFSSKRDSMSLLDEEGRVLAEFVAENR